MYCCIVAVWLVFVMIPGRWLILAGTCACMGRGGMHVSMLCFPSHYCHLHSHLSYSVFLFSFRPFPSLHCLSHAMPSHLLHYIIHFHFMNCTIDLPAPTFSPTKSNISLYVCTYQWDCTSSCTCLCRNRRATPLVK